jgi:sugar-specific transcriptional regulator TrmB
MAIQTPNVDREHVLRLRQNDVPVREIARQLSVSEGHIYYCLAGYAHRKLVETNTTRHNRRKHYRALPLAELYERSDYHYQRVEYYQGCLDDLEAEIKRRKAKDAR